MQTSFRGLFCVDQVHVQASALLLSEELLVSLALSEHLLLLDMLVGEDGDSCDDHEGSETEAGPQ